MKLNWLMQKSSQLAMYIALFPDLSDSILNICHFCVGKEVVLILFDDISATTQKFLSPALQVTLVHHTPLKVSSRGAPRIAFCSLWVHPTPQSRTDEGEELSWLKHKSASF